MAYTVRKFLQIQRIMRARSKLTWRYKHEWDNTVKDFIDSNKFPGMKLISDNSGINREIKRGSDYCSAGYEKFLVGGELLLTSLMIYEKLDERMMLSHLEELNKKQVSGFIVKRIQNTAHQNELFETLLLFAMNIVFRF